MSTRECDLAFQAIKQVLQSDTLLKFPDLENPFILQTDASGPAIGFVLGQEEGGTRPSVRVHWVACGTCSVPGNFFQVGVCSRYNARSDWLIVTSPRADYGLAKTKQKVIKKPYNKLLTNRASSSRTGEYWPWVVFVRTSLRSVRTATTSGQYFPGSTALALG